jgi:hypothetical protein
VNEIVVPLPLRRAAPAPAPGYVTDVTLEIYADGSVAGSRTPIATFVTRTGTDGTFTVQIAGGLSGRYDFVVKPAGAISREVNSVAVQRGVAETLTYSTFDEGDANGDDAVDAADDALLRAGFGRAGGEPGFDGRADFNRDGVISILDFSLLTRSYSLRGPVQEP